MRMCDNSVFTLYIYKEINLSMTKFNTLTVANRVVGLFSVPIDIKLVINIDEFDKTTFIKRT